jgi:hypothetical protein
MDSEPERQQGMKSDRTRRFMPTRGELLSLGIWLGLYVVGCIVILKLSSIYLYGINFALELHRLLVYIGAVILVSCVVTLFKYFAQR